jgi:hypothetical protein
VLVKGLDFFSSAGLTPLCPPPNVLLKGFDVEPLAKAPVAVAKGDEVLRDQLMNVLETLLLAPGL